MKDGKNSGGRGQCVKNPDSVQRQGGRAFETEITEQGGKRDLTEDTTWSERVEIEGGGKGFLRGILRKGR